MENSKGDEKPTGKEVAADKSTESVVVESKPSQEAHSSKWGNVTVVKVKPLNKAEVSNKASGVTSRPLATHPSRRSGSTVNAQQKLQSEVSSGASGVTTVPLAAHASRRIMEHMQEQRDRPELSIITRRILATRGSSRYSSMVTAQKQDDEENVQSGTSAVRSRPLGAHPNRRRSTTVSVQEQDPSHYYSRRARDEHEEDASGEEERRFGACVLAWD